jgi:hypothetical protein
MRYLFALVAACALMMGTALAQQQYPQTQQPYPQTQQPYPQQQYPQAQQPYPNQYPQNQQPYPQTPVYPQQQPATVYNQNGIRGMTLPVGTQLSIRTNEAINATKQDVGRSYSAEIAQPVMGQNGQVLIPQYSPATLTVASMSTGTMGMGSNQVALALQSLTINGQSYNVQTNTATQSGNKGIGANKRTAEMTGGGALLGTIIGAVAGGGKGALIGAVVGGAGGAAAQVLTRGSQVKVPAESLLTFKLDQPLTLQ